MPAIQLFLFKLKYFPTVWAVKIKSVSAAYKCLVSPPRESPPSALGPSRFVHPARPLLESSARRGRRLSALGPPSTAPAARAPRAASRAPSEAGGRAPPQRAQDQTRFASRPPPSPSQARPRPRRAVVSLQIGFPEPCPWECVCVGCLYNSWVCRRRAEVVGFSFTLRKLAPLLPPGVSLLPFFPSLPPSLSLSWSLPLLCLNASEASSGEKENPGAALLGSLLWTGI